MGLTGFVARNLTQIASGGYAPGRPRIAFIHVPKCGGSSLFAAVRTAMGLRLQLPGGGSARFSHEASSRASAVLDRNSNLFSADLLPYYLSNPELRLVSGHMPVRSSVMEAFRDEWDFLLLLRDPVQRWLSNYFFNRYKADDHYRIDQTLDEFLETYRACWYGCFYCSYLAPDSLSYGEEATDGVVEEAVEKLKRFRIIGVLERLEDMAKAFEEAYGASLRVPHVNRNPRGEDYGSREVRADQLERIRSICSPDLAVYRKALELIGPDSVAPSAD